MSPVTVSDIGAVMLWSVRPSDRALEGWGGPLSPRLERAAAALTAGDE